jgi:GNAT superfamily N-acetyltransferase
MTQPREDKYKAKNSIDTFVYRAGDQIGAWSYPLSPGLASVSQEFHLLLHRSRLFGASLVSGWDENKERWPMETETADKFLIRLATIDDVDVIAWHRVRMFQDMGEVPSHLFEAFRARSRERLRDVIARREYIGWLTSLRDAPDKVIAGVGVHLRRVLPHPMENAAGFADGRHGIIVNVFTEPEWRRKGLAATLLKRIIDWAREQQLDELILHSSTEGRPLYERLGFIPTSEMRFAGNSPPET